MSTSTAERITINAQGDKVTLMTTEEAMTNARAIIEKVSRFWSKQSIAEGDEAAMNKLTSRLNGNLKMDHPAFAATYPLLLLMMARGIIDMDALRVHFDDVATKGGIGNDDEQIDRVARYMAYANAATKRRMDPRCVIRKSDVRGLKKKYAETLKAEKNKTKTALEELKADREKSRDAAHSTAEEDAKKDEASDAALAELHSELVNML